jgi:hypothetical protein
LRNFSPPETFINREYKKNTSGRLGAADGSSLNMILDASNFRSVGEGFSSFFLILNFIHLPGKGYSLSLFSLFPSSLTLLQGCFIIPLFLKEMLTTIDD